MAQNDPLGILGKKRGEDPLGLLNIPGMPRFGAEVQWRGPPKPGLEEPWVPNPFEMVGAIGGAGAKLGLPLGKALLSGIIGAGAEFPIGFATEEIEPKHPHLALPFNIITGVISGVSVERAIEKGIIRVFLKKGIKATPQRINLAVSRVKGQLRTGELGDRFTREAATEVNQALVERPETGLLKKEFTDRFFHAETSKVTPEKIISPITKLEVLPGTDPPIRKTLADMHKILEEEFPKRAREVQEFPPKPPKKPIDATTKLKPTTIMEAELGARIKQFGPEGEISPEMMKGGLFEEARKQMGLPIVEKTIGPTVKKAKPAHKANTLIEWVKRKGGIWDESLPQEMQEFTEKESGIPFLIRKKGWAFDELVDEAINDGWLPPGSTSDELREALRKDIIGQRFNQTRPSNDFKIYGGLVFQDIPELWTKLIGGPVWDKLIMQKLPKLLDRIPGGRHVNRAFLYEYRGTLPNTPGYIRSLDDMRRYQAMGREYALDLGNRLSEMPEKSQLAMGEYIRGEIDTLPAGEGKLADEAKRSLYDLGKQAVDLGLLSEKVFFRNAGRYMPRLYTSKEYHVLLKLHGLEKPMRLDLTRFMKRKDIPKEIREAMGEILTPGYPVAKGITQLTHDIEMAKYFKGIADNPEWSFNPVMGKIAEETIPTGFRQLPQNRKLGVLSGRYVHPEIYNDIQETIRVMETPERVWRKVLGMWKVGKIVNPKTMARNLFGGNVILSHLGGFPIWRQPIGYLKALSDIRSKGEYFLALRKRGVLKTTWTQGELRQLFDIEAELSGLGRGSMPENMAFMQRAWTRMEVFARKGGRAYQALEEWSKLAHFIDAVERRGMPIDEAAAEAQKWLFDYSKVTRFQEKYRTKWYGAPFATFTFKALPRIAEATIKTPWRVGLIGAMIYGVEKAAQRKFGDTPEEIKAKKELRPDWQKGSFLGIPNYARVPLLDDFGREYYWNLTYWLPWGDIGEGGGFGPIPGSLVPMSQPFVRTTYQLKTNFDEFWRKPIVGEEETAGKSGIAKFLTGAELTGIHLGQSLAPTMAIDIAKGVQALRGRPDYRGRERHPLAVGLDVFAGIKLYPVDYSEQMVRNINKLDPKRGSIARKIHSQIKSFSVKRATMAKKGKPTAHYDKAIAGKLKQLQGLAKEVGEISRKGAPAFREKEADPLGLL